MEFVLTAIPGLVEIHTRPIPDARGRFVKTFVAEEYAAAGLPSAFAEEFYSFSTRGVLRGLHFQNPPHAQGKTVFCEHGAIFDAILDLRAGSPAYGVALTFELTAENGLGLYVPPGLAHGFCVVGDAGLVAYRTTSGYAPQADAGIRWDSAGIDWPLASPLVSEKDAALLALDGFASPFAFEAV